MTDLLNRSTGPATPRKPRARGDSGEPPSRSLATNGLLAGTVASLVTLGLCMALAVTGWFLTDAGTHGDTPDALRVGANAWLVGHGSGLTFSGAPLGLVPLGLTLVLVLAAFRCGRWAGQASAPADDPVRALPPAVAAYCLAHALVTVATWVLASTPAASPSLGRGMLGAVLVAATGGGTGLAVGTGALDDLVARVPALVRTIVYGAVVGVLGVVVAASVVLATALALSLNEAATVISGLHLGLGDAISYTVVIALLAPNCVLLAAAYLLGPGFAVGTGTVVAPTGVTVGMLPAFPVLAAVPDEGPAPGWLLVVAALPPIAAAVAAGMAQLRSPYRAYDVGALGGAAAGVGAAVLLAVAISLAGGPLGSGRMADIGAPFFEVLVIACGGMGVGGMLGGVLTTWWQRRREGD